MAENNPFPGENNTGHYWDDNLRELSNPPPRWWMLAFWASMAWVVLYSVLYPTWPVLDGGQAANKGLLGWTQMDEYEKGVAEVEAVRADYENKIKGMDVNAILSDPDVKQYSLASAKVIFGDYCAPCHGSGGQGNPGYPVLADDDWLFGGTADNIVMTVTKGRGMDEASKQPMAGGGGVMTAHVTGGVMTDAEARKMAKWVTAMKNEGKPMDHDAEANQMYLTKGCIACHGVNAKGVDALGAADLTIPVWRFEPGGEESAYYTIANGVNDHTNPQTRGAHMPMFENRLSADEIKKVAVYVHQLGGGQ
jgi:cytochrome c oxidase cbb3-type subunit 3